MTMQILPNNSLLTLMSVTSPQVVNRPYLYQRMADCAKSVVKPRLPAQLLFVPDFGVESNSQAQYLDLAQIRSLVDHIRIEGVAGPEGDAVAAGEVATPGGY